MVKPYPYPRIVLLEFTDERGKFHSVQKGIVRNYAERQQAEYRWGGGIRAYLGVKTPVLRFEALKPLTEEEVEACRKALISPSIVKCG